jgi:hypothetical protein
MSSLSIVEDFDVVEQAGFGLLVCHVVFSMHPLFFECGKETLDHRIVPAVALAAHTARNIPLLKPPLIGMRGVLATPVTVKEQRFWSSSWLWPARRLRADGPRPFPKPCDTFLAALDSQSLQVALDARAAIAPLTRRKNLQT